MIPCNCQVNENHMKFNMIDIFVVWGRFQKIDSPQRVGQRTSKIGLASGWLCLSGRVSFLKESFWFYGTICGKGAISHPPVKRVYIYIYIYIYTHLRNCNGMLRIFIKRFVATKSHAYRAHRFPAVHFMMYLGQLVGIHNETKQATKGQAYIYI